MGESLLNQTIKNKLYDHSVAMDHDKLWANIQNEQKSKPLLFFWLLGIGIILGSCFAAFYFSDIDSPSPQNHKAIVISEIPKENKKGSQTSTTDFDKLIGSSDQITKTESTNSQSNYENKFEKFSAENLKNISKSQELHFSSQLSNSSKYSEFTYSSNPVFKEVQYEKIQSANLNKPLSQNEKKKNIAFNNEKLQTPKFLANQELNLLSISSVESKYDVNKKKKQINCFDHKIKRNSFALEVYGGPGLISKQMVSTLDGYKNLLDKRKETETSLESLRAGVVARFNHNSGIYIKAGVEVSRLRERLDFSVGRDTSYTLENQIVDWNIDMNGDSTPIIGNLIITESGSKTWKIYNEFKTWDIPIVLGFKSNVGNWGYFGEAGIIYNLSLKNKGLILDNSFLPSDLEPLFENNNGLHLTAAFGISYQFSKHVYGYISPSMKFSQRNFNVDSYPINQKFHSYNILIGFGYNFIKGPKTL